MPFLLATDTLLWSDTLAWTGIFDQDEFDGTYLFPAVPSGRWDDVFVLEVEDSDPITYYRNWALLPANEVDGYDLWESFPEDEFEIFSDVYFPAGLINSYEYDEQGNASPRISDFGPYVVTFPNSFSGDLRGARAEVEGNVTWALDGRTYELDSLDGGWAYDEETLTFTKPAGNQLLIQGGTFRPTDVSFGGSITIENTRLEVWGEWTYAHELYLKSGVVQLVDAPGDDATLSPQTLRIGPDVSGPIKAFMYAPEQTVIMEHGVNLPEGTIYLEGNATLQLQGQSRFRELDVIGQTLVIDQPIQLNDFIYLSESTLDIASGGSVTTPTIEHVWYEQNTVSVDGELILQDTFAAVSLDLIVNGGTLVAQDGLSIEAFASGRFENGATIQVTGPAAVYNDGTLSLSKAKVTSTGPWTIADVGTMTVDNQSSVTVPSTIVGTFGSNAVLVDDPPMVNGSLQIIASQWDSPSVVVGLDHLGRIAIDDLGELLVETMEIGVGTSGQGEVTIASGGRLRASTLDLGTEIGSIGSLMIAEGGLLTGTNVDASVPARKMVVGNAGLGNVEIAAQGVANVASMIVGEHSTSVGTVVVRGTLNAGPDIHANEALMLGANDGASGRLDVLGADATLKISSGSPAYVGFGGNGQMTVAEGGSVQGNLVVGGGIQGGPEAGTGSVVIDGSGSTLQAIAVTLAGSRGSSGDLVIVNGATADVLSTLDLGRAEQATGRLQIAGIGSSVTTETLEVRTSGAAQATVHVSDEATLRTTYARLTTFTQGTTNVTIQGGTWEHRGRLDAFVQGMTRLTVQDGGTLWNQLNTDIETVVGGDAMFTVTGPGSLWRCGDDYVVTDDSGQVTGSVFVGEIRIVGNSPERPAILEISDQARVETGVFSAWHTASVVLKDGTLQANDASIWVGATLSGNGTIDGDLRVQGGTISPGLSTGTLEVTGDLTMSSDSTLMMEIGGVQLGTETDQLLVGGVARLSGFLELHLLSNPSASPEDEFVLLNALEIAGNFEGVKVIGGTADLVITPTEVKVTRVMISSSSLGDFDGDQQFSLADLELLSAELRRGTSDPQFDVNQDGVVDYQDRTDWIHTVMNTYFGDANLDGEFNTGDLVRVFQFGEYEDALPLNSTWGTGDWDGNGDFTTGDLVFAFQDGGFEQGPRNAVSAVPEPSTGSLVTLVAALALMRGRRNRSSCSCTCSRSSHSSDSTTRHISPRCPTAQVVQNGSRSLVGACSRRIELAETEWQQWDS
jgi:T5SS/PEP-CTERM-associated repeat protein